MAVGASPSSGSVGSVAQDCNLSGPTINNGGSTIVNLGSSGNTNGAGCDGCTVSRHHFEVTWGATGTGFATIPGQGTNIESDVTSGDTSTINLSMDVAIDCDDTMKWMVGVKGSGQDVSTLEWQCHACQ
ncbi:MAG: hypothetical protein KAI24_14800 [Planctomycetes bacterium]|nr:hypothetical protein [Planctomycetota bacterium]